jgi:hypothetical protein
MTHRSRVFYTHRRSRNGAYESICLNCYCVVGRAKSELELGLSEDQHTCREADSQIVHSMLAGDCEWQGRPN